MNKRTAGRSSDCGGPLARVASRGLPATPAYRPRCDRRLGGRRGDRTQQQPSR
jgi:hypothetical protein